MTLETTIERDGVEIDITVEFTVRGGCRGSRDSLCGKRGAGPPLEPDEPDEIEFESVTGPDGKEVELTQAEEKWIEEKCWDEVADNYNQSVD